VYLNRLSSSKSGLYLSTASILLAAAFLCMVDVHKRNIRRRKQRRLEHTKSILSTATTDFTNSACPMHTSSAMDIEQQESQAQKLAALAVSTGAAGGGASLALMGGVTSSAAGLPVGMPLPAVASYTNLLAAAAAVAVSEHVRFL